RVKKVLRIRICRCRCMGVSKCIYAIVLEMRSEYYHHDQAKLSGFILPPFLIYKGSHHYMGWHRLSKNLDIDDYQSSYSSKGWTNRELGLEWLKHFDRCTKNIAKGKKRVIIIDGHDSHVQIDFIEYALAAN